ncbi:hypothetical protein F0L74_21370 [Chitinophaga agrisoli]|uniref:Uncharacterized protein n=1 Tax=Chitinophaga agrisoli TaxID=2607653 RepID=A0A5B2VJB3_9BACT|nr:hypothetical protein [Chitinophaga agrisoli]KAA2238768.1 hypothetical protein F0L74_21370 [Chitinophaga agrisoli]
MNRFIIFTVILILWAGYKAIAQDFDSARVFPLHMKATFTVRITRDLVRNQADTIIVLDSANADAAYALFQNGIKD